MTGHLPGASAEVEFVSAIQASRTGWVHPNASPIQSTIASVAPLGRLSYVSSSTCSLPSQVLNEVPLKEIALQTNSASSAVVDLSYGLSSPMPVHVQADENHVFLSITTFESNSLKIMSSFTKQSGKPQVSVIQATFMNMSSNAYTDSIFQAVVPKFIQLHLDPSTNFAKMYTSKFRLNEDKMIGRPWGVPGEFVEDSKFIPLNADDPINGPPALLLMGFYVEETYNIKKKLKDFDDEFLKVCHCNKDLLTKSIWEAMHTEQPDLKAVKVAKSVPRICFLSGLTGEEMMMIIDAFSEAGLKPVIFAAFVPNSANKLLPGGDATELTVSATLKQSSSFNEGIEKWPYEAVVVAFEAIPRPLAQNCRVNVIRTITFLQGKHANSENACVGIDGNTGTVVDTRRMIWDLGIKFLVPVGALMQENVVVVKLLCIISNSVFSIELLNPVQCSVYGKFYAIRCLTLRQCQFKGKGMIGTYNELSKLQSVTYSDSSSIQMLVAAVANLSAVI